MNYFIFGYGCAAVAGVATISVPAATCTTYNHASKSDMARYENPDIITFPQTVSSEKTRSHQLALERLLSLETGWDSYNAPTPCKKAIDQATALVTKLERSGLLIQHIGPSVIGGVGITIEDSGIEYAIEFRNSGKVVLTVIDEDNGVTVREIADSPILLSTVLNLLSKDVA